MKSRGKIRCILLAVLSGALAFGVQSDQSAKLARLNALVGHWNIAADVRFPAEAAGKMSGTLNADWALDRSFVKLDGTLKNSQGTILHATGYVTYDDDGPYAQRRYRGYFLASGDSRCLVLAGRFSRATLELTGAPVGDPARDPIECDATFDGNRKISIVVESRKGKPQRLAEIDLTRTK